jgi:hypothetical protein
MGMSTNEGRVAITMMGNLFIVGRIAEGNMINPRIVTQIKSEMKGPEGQDIYSLVFEKILFSPEVFMLGGNPYWFSENDEFNVKYIESTDDHKEGE